MGDAAKAARSSALGVKAKATGASGAGKGKKSTVRDAEKKVVFKGYLQSGLEPQWSVLRPHSAAASRSGRALSSSSDACQSSASLFPLVPCQFCQFLSTVSFPSTWTGAHHAREFTHLARPRTSL